MKKSVRYFLIGMVGLVVALVGVSCKFSSKLLQGILIFGGIGLAIIFNYLGYQELKKGDSTSKEEEYPPAPIPALERKCFNCGHTLSGKYCSNCGSHAMDICQGCGEHLAEGQKFCPQCGHVAPKVPACSCGANRVPGTKFCPECGAKY